MNMRDNYDVVFVLPGITLGYPPGGYDVVYRLAGFLGDNDLSVAIIFWNNFSLYSINKKKTSNIYDSLIKTFFYNKKIKRLYQVLPIVNRIRGIDYSYDHLKKIDLYMVNNPREISFKTKAMFATAWETAYFVKDYIQNVDKTAKAFYFIQNSEDDPSFSHEYSEKARETYSFDFRKIVINKKLLERFKKDNPSFFNVGIDTDFFKVTKPISERDDVILFPLRMGESKGARYAFDAMKIILRKRNKVKLMGFGNIESSAIPAEVRDQLIYYHRPSRAKLREIYNQAKVFVLPSIVEGFPLPPLEAMACGDAVVSTDNGGSTEYINDGENGYICPVKDSECLAERALYLLENDAERRRIANKGTLTAVSFSYNSFQTKFLNFIQKEI